MSNNSPRTAQIRSVFSRVAEGKLAPDNFGSTLLTAATEGLSTKRRIANILGTDIASIRKAGNNLKQREAANVARALLQ